MSVLLVWIWLGGISLTYRIRRVTGSTMVEAAIDALVWPTTLGRVLVLLILRHGGFIR